MSKVTKCSEYCHLFGIWLRIQFLHFIEFIRVIFRYYSNYTFLKIDQTLIFTYFFKNPFRLSRQFLEKKGDEELYAYGETPLTTLDAIMKQCDVSKEDTLFELGSGRGRACFWLHCFIGCEVVGIEYIPEFVAHAEQIRKKFALDTIEFRKEDFLQADFTGATVIYLYGTCLADEVIEKLIDKFEKLPPGTKIITVSYSLNEYTRKPLFEVMKCFPASYPWGSADIYLQYR